MSCIQIHYKLNKNHQLFSCQRLQSERWACCHQLLLLREIHFSTNLWLVALPPPSGYSSLFTSSCTPPTHHHRRHPPHFPLIITRSALSIHLPKQKKPSLDTLCLSHQLAGGSQIKRALPGDLIFSRIQEAASLYHIYLPARGSQWASGQSCWQVNPSSSLFVSVQPRVSPDHRSDLPSLWFHNSFWNNKSRTTQEVGGWQHLRILEDIEKWLTEAIWSHFVGTVIKYCSVVLMYFQDIIMQLVWHSMQFLLSYQILTDKLNIPR